MKRDNELQKPVTHISIWLGKRESNSCIEMYGAQKAKDYLSMLKYKKFQALILKRVVLFKKDQMLWFMQKPNEKLLSFVIISIIEIVHLIECQLCMTWLNWSLKLHSGLRTIPHLILIHNIQDFDSINAYLICVIVHVQMWFVCSITCRSNPKRFLSILYVFESDFILSCF